jgi:hypothetical protein
MAAVSQQQRQQQQQQQHRVYVPGLGPRVIDVSLAGGWVQLCVRLWGAWVGAWRE